ncbi:MAG TPA: acyl-CoA dehydrogenase family protein, partial [Porticoccaceae bacterium]|nr:acyl-CoA dehydrogenase family protein [Porticoccaceae bacterium]
MPLGDFTSWFDQPLSPLYYSADHLAWRDTLRRFVDTEVAPHVDEWEEAGHFPREMYRKAAAIGLLQLGYPEEYGGIPVADPFMAVVTAL